MTTDGQEHVPKKLPDFFDKNMLHFIDFERFLFDRTIPSDQKTLEERGVDVAPVVEKQRRAP